MDHTLYVFIFNLLLFGLQSALSAKLGNGDIYSYHINTTVTSRYAITVISSRVTNIEDSSKEIEFHVKIPKTAFISKFRMTIDGETYDGVVKQKEKAKQQYTEAVSRGQSAGIISSVGRTLEDFKTSVTIAPHKKVTFELTYEELLQRRLGKYELLINVQPGQVVRDFKVDVNIFEKPGINFLRIEGSLKDMANAITTIQGNNQVWVNFYPTADQQTQCNGCDENGLQGDLKILYDVNRPQSQGDITVQDGYFVHFFAPTDLPRIPKNVVFIIDQSGSMSGRKIEQTREALLKILDDLAEDDFFGLILFDSRVTPWKNELVQATSANLHIAREFVKKIVDRGSTDINAAVLKGVDMINKHPREGSASLLILLTDGDPTSGETNQGKIQSNVREAIGKMFPLYCLGFGFDVNFEFLQKMAQENSGIARRIYTDSDAALQLKGFYEEVATPLLTSVHVNYTGAANVTQTVFSHYYNGSEIVVAGVITDNNVNDFSTEVIAISKNNKVTYRDITSVAVSKPLSTMSSFDNFMQRLWACLTVKQLLEKELTLTGEDKEEAKKTALELSLKYGFVTPLTSMVVTKPEGEGTQVADKPKEGEKQPPQSRRAHHGGQRPPMMMMPFNGATRVGVRGEAGRPGYRAHMPRPRYRTTGSSSALLMPASRDDYLETETTSIQAILNVRIPQSSHVYSTESLVTFLLTADGLVPPLCYDIPSGHSLRLLQEPTSGFSMNGKLQAADGKGFKRITVHLGPDKHIKFDLNNITIKDKQSTESYMWTSNDVDITTDSLTLLIRDNEVDVTFASIRVVILLHQRNGKSFLWPAVRTRPTGSSIPGILGKLPVPYEVIQSNKLKVLGQEVDSSSASARDYRIKSAPEVRCYLVDLKDALGGELSDYTVSQL